ncbi:hypothetical protein B0H17DRAFT_1187577, partial [Mycena rosella]
GILRRHPHRRQQRRVLSRHRRSGGDYDNNSGSTGFGNTQNDQFDSSNTSGGYGQDRCREHHGRHERLVDGVVPRYGQFLVRGRELRAFRRPTRRAQFQPQRVWHRQRGEQDRQSPYGDKLKGEAEKLAGKVTGNAGLQERDQERKVHLVPGLPLTPCAHQTI